MKFTFSFALAVLLPLSAMNAQSGRRNEPGRIVDRPTVPVTGSVLRKDIPNEYLEVNLASGTIHLEGTAKDVVEWDLAAGTETVPPNLGFTGPVRAVYTDGYPGTFGTTTWQDRFTLDIGPVLRLSPAKLQSDLRLRVPRSLKLIHLSVHGGGKVIANGFDGEITITVDSGQIVATNLNGPVLLEARNGGVTLDLSTSPFKLGPVELLSHNGSIELTLPANPSVLFELSTDCGEVHSDFQLAVPKPSSVTSNGWTDPKYSGGQADCTLRPKSLPPLDGVLKLRYRMAGSVGNGELTVRAKSLQGDINIKRKGED